MHFLTTPGLQTPATHQAWAALEEDELAQVGEVYKEQVYVDAHDSPMVTSADGAPLLRAWLRAQSQIGLQSYR